MTFARWELRFIADLATAVKWQVEADVEAGVPFDQAKRGRIEQAAPSWKHLSPQVRQAVSDVCWSISPSDLSKRTIRIGMGRIREMIEQDRGDRLGWFDSLLFRLFGVVW